MTRLEATRMIERMTSGQRCDITNEPTANKLMGVRSEIRQFCVGSEAYRELYNIIGSVNSLYRKDNPYLVDGKYLNLEGFFDLGEAKKMVINYLEEIDLDYLDDDEARDLLMELAENREMNKFVELLIGYPIYAPKQSWETAQADPEFYRGRECDYSYTETVQRADIGTVRGALGWLYMHAFPIYYF